MLKFSITYFKRGAIFESIMFCISNKIPYYPRGMGNISSPKLVAAVSNAGGLGTIGCGTMTPAEVEERIVATKQLTQNHLPSMCQLMSILIQRNYCN